MLYKCTIDIMKKAFNTFISLNRKETLNLVKVMNGELQPKITKKRLKSIFSEWKKLKDKIIF